MARVMSYVTAMTDSGSSIRGTKVEKVYNEKTGQWEPVTVYVDSNGDSVAPTPSTGNTSGNTDSKKDAEKEYIESEFNVLTGELNITPTEKSIRIKVGDTIKIEGVGKYLSGLYFVSSIKRTVNKDSGYSQSLSVIKNGFGDSLKKASTSSTRKNEVSKSSSSVKVGDSVKIVGDDAVYSNAHDGVKVPAWVKKKTLTVQKVSDDGTRVLLKEITSWTYVKFVQKV